MHAIWKKIAAGELAPVYLLTGLEQHLLDETIKRIAKALQGTIDADAIRFDLLDTPIETVLEEADTLPFFDEHKLIIAQNAFFLKAADRKIKMEQNTDLLKEWLKNPSPTATVIFTAPYEKLDKRLTITKTMTNSAVVVEANRLSGNDLFTWIAHEGSAAGIRISNDTAAYLSETAGDDLTLLSNEIDKISLYLNGEGEVTKELIDRLVVRQPEVDVFRLTESYINGNVSKTLSIYHDLLRNGEEPIMLTSLIAGQIRLMVHVAGLQKKGYQQQQMAKILNVHPYRIKLIMQNRRLPAADHLMQLLNDLSEIDYKLKSTGGKRERVLELFFMNAFNRVQV